MKLNLLPGYAVAGADNVSDKHDQYGLKRIIQSFD